MCHDKQRGCVSMLFFSHNYCKMWSFCLQCKTASTNSKQRGSPPQKKDFLATPSKVEPKITSKKGNKIAGEINSYNVKMKSKNKHLTYLHLVTESKQRLDGEVITRKCRPGWLSTFSLWLCSSFKVVLLHVSTPESLTWGSHHAKSSSNECPPKRTIFFCLSDKVCVGSDINACSIVFLFPLWLFPTGVG